jgi:hypothetical protein
MPASDAGRPLGRAGSGDGQSRSHCRGPLCGAVPTSRSSPGNRCRCEQARTPKQANSCSSLLSSLRAALAISGRLPSAIGPQPTRVGHLRTTPKCNWAPTHPRWPSQDDSQVQLGPNPPAFAISRRHALAGWGVQPPLWLERPADLFRSTRHQRIPYALERPQGLAIDTF